MDSLSPLLPISQLAITPVILISGMGVLLIASRVDFLRDIFVSLHALKLRARQRPATVPSWSRN